MSDSLLATYPSLSGRTVLVTGGASGIGEAIVRAFAGQKAKVGFLDIQEMEGNALAAELRGQGAKVHFEPVDITDTAAFRRQSRRSLRRSARSTSSSTTPPTIRARLQGETPESFERRLAVNLKPQFFAIPPLRRA